MSKDFITREEWGVIESIRAKGAVVVVFFPDDLQGADPEGCENVMTERGWIYIEDTKDPDFKPEDDEEE